MIESNANSNSANGQNKPTILHLIWELGLGGDAKNLCQLAINQKHWSNPVAATISQSPGLRSSQLKEAGIAVFSGIQSKDALESLLSTLKPILVIFHRNGGPNNQETVFVKTIKEHNIAVFEFNTFARFDKSTQGLWTGHAHLSRASLVQYARRKGKNPLELSGHKAIGYALEIPEPITAKERLLARQALNIAENTFVLLRLQRPDLRKWSALPVVALSQLHKNNKNFHLIIQAAPKERLKWIKRECGNNATTLEAGTDNKQLRQVFAASDCLVNFSNIGETFGLAMAEGMSFGLPAIVNSTPKRDNAQIELVKHLGNGLITNSLTSFIAGLNLLQTNTSLYKDLAKNARADIANTFAAELVERRMTNFMHDSLQANANEFYKVIPSIAENSPYSLTLEWLQDYESLEKIENFALPDKTLSLKDDICRQSYLKYLELEDAWLYANAIGLEKTLEKLWTRIKQGNLRRP